MRILNNLNDGWMFSRQSLSQSFLKKIITKWEKVNLPHTWNALDGQDGGMDYYRGKCSYKKTVFISPKSGERIYLEIFAASLKCSLFVNKKAVVFHSGGFSAFRADITDFIKHEKAELVINVDNSENNGIYPQTADFTFFGGLYRGVSLITVSDSHFSLDDSGSKGIYVTPKLSDDGSADINISYKITNSDNCKVQFRSAGIEKTVDATEEGNTVLSIKNPHLWNGRKDPYLYTLCATLIKDNKIIDELSIKYGIRDFSVDSEKGFFLNGISYPLRGVSRHQDRENMGWAITEKEHIEDIDIICDVGANAVRLAHYQHSQFFYDLCDERGLIVWAEIPFISSQLDGEEAQRNTLSQMTELIKQSYNHPSIVCWGIANEITIGGEVTNELKKNLNLLNDLCHSLDKTRFTTIAQLSMVENSNILNSITDAIAYNHYFGWYTGKVDENGPWIDKFHREFPEIPLGISEYGAEGIINYHSDDPKIQDYTEEYQSYYHRKMLETFESRNFLWCTFAWNMFDFASDMRDEGGVKGRNNKGLVTYDRKIKKDSYYIYKAYWSDDSFIHICEKRFAERSVNKINIKIFSNLSQIALTVNGKKVETKTGCRYFEFNNVVLKSGINSIIAECGEYSDKAEFIFTNSPSEIYTFENESESSVKNWFEGIENTGKMEFPDGFYSIHDTIGDIMKSPEGLKMVNSMIEKVESELNFKVSKSMLLMAKGFTVEKVIGLAGSRLPNGTDIQANIILNGIKK